MNHNLVAKKFVEDFLNREGAEATNDFKDTLTNAIEDLLEDAIAGALESASDANDKQTLVWKKNRQSQP